MTLLHLSWLLAIPLVILPGFLLHRLYPGEDDEPVEAVFASITSGVWLTSITAVTLVGLAGMLAKVHLRGWTVMAVALAFSVLFLWRLARRGPLGPQLILDRRSWLVFGVALAILAFTAVYYDRLLFDEERCIIRSSVLPYHNYWTAELPMLGQVPDWMFERNGFMIFNGGLREGMSYVITPFMAVFEFLGFRLVYAFSFFAIAGGIYTIVRRLVGGRSIPVLAMLFTCLNPYTLRMMSVDDNLFALATGTVALAWLLRGPPSWFWWMLPYGLFIGIRHECALTLPGVLLYLRHRPARGRNLAARRRQLALGALVFTLPFVITHLNLAFVAQLPPYEPLTLYPPMEHDFLGLFEFTLRGGLNWPFTAQLLRSLHTPFPPLIAFPLDMLNGLGIALWALVPAGLLALWRDQRAWFWLGLGWFLPFMAMLMVQSNWTEPDKMGIPNSVLTPVVLWMALGLAALLRGPGPWWRRALLPAATMGVLAFSVSAARGLDFAVDARANGFEDEEIHDVVPIRSLEEDPALIAFVKERMTTPSLLPSLRGRSPGSIAAGLTQGGLLRVRAEVLLEDLAHPEFSTYHPAAPAMMRSLIGLDELMHFPVSRMAEGGHDAWFGAAPSFPEPTSLVELEMDLGRRPGSDHAILVPAEGPGPDPIPLVGPGVMRIANIPVGWTDRPVAFSAISGMPTGPMLVLMFGEFDSDPPTGVPVLAWRDGSGLQETRVRLAVPTGCTIALTQNTSLHPNRREIWQFTIGEDGGVIQSGPIAQ